MTGTTMIDLGPQARIVAMLAQGVTDEQLTASTPCPDYVVGHLLAHVAGLSVAFRDAAHKTPGTTTDHRPDGTLPELGPGWRRELPEALDALARAWREPSAWGGMTRAGGMDLPGEVAAAVAADELVVHGWDLARATGQEYVPDPVALEAAYGFLRAAAEMTDRGPFGPLVPVPENAPLLERAIGLSGRDPGWKP
ncbi:TIGR03086 family metal-binding protein [Streptomyces sp. NPDC001220]